MTEEERARNYAIYTNTTGTPRFGKARAAVVGCKCEAGFTCRACLNNSGGVFTPSTNADIIRMQKEKKDGTKL